MLTTGNVDDRVPVSSLAKGLFGKCFGDKGYLSSKLFQELWERGIKLTTKLKKGMHNKLITLWEKLLLQKRRLIENVHNKLKNGCLIEHHHHRSPWNFMVNLLGGLIAYCRDPHKPAFEFERSDRALIEQFAA